MAEISRVAREGVTAEELLRARNQLRARFVFENDSVTNIAHQLGYFDTVSSWELFRNVRDRIAQVTPAQVNDVARDCLRAANQTIGWFVPLPLPAAGTAPHPADPGAPERA